MWPVILTAILFSSGLLLLFLGQQLKCQTICTHGFIAVVALVGFDGWRVFYKLTTQAHVFPWTCLALGIIATLSDAFFIYLVIDPQAQQYLKSRCHLSHE